MPIYPIAQHPGDNASMRLHDRPPPTVSGSVKVNGVRTTAIWFMAERPESRARYNVLFSSETPPASYAEALERAGATFFSHCTSTVVYDYSYKL